MERQLTPRRGRRLAVGLATLALAAMAGCSDDDATTPATPFDGTAVLQSLSNGVILSTYTDLAARAADLKTATDALQGDPSEANLGAARAAWRATRRPWEQSEGFLFGPVDTQGIDPSIDSWPVNVTDLQAVLAGPNTLTADFIDGLEGTLKGFHTIEYLLFGESGTRAAAAFSLREFEYLAATAESLRRATVQLATAWSASGGDYAGQLVRAGQTGSVYISQKAAVQELVAGMVGIADEVGNGKINDPYTSGDATLEESRFSANSIVDFQDNIRSVQHVYRGDYASSSGEGIRDIVAVRNAALDQRIEQQIQAAIDAIGAIPPPFSTAIVTQGAAVEAAQAAVRALHATLEGELAPLIGAL